MLKLSLQEIVELLSKENLLLSSQILKEETALLTAVTTSPKEVSKAHVFCAYKGVRFDAHQEVSGVIARGVGLLVFEDKKTLEKEKNLEKTSWIHVSNSRRAWSFISSAFFDHPQKKLTMIGVTGTNGKTSTTWIMRSILKELGIDCLYVGTLGFYLGDHYESSGHTTPDPTVFFAGLKKALDQGIKTVVMEVSSHALAQYKLDPISFDLCAFTSFSRDHLDFHQSMEEYWQAKLRLFLELSKSKAIWLVHHSLREKFLKGASETLKLKTYGIYNKESKQDFSIEAKAFLKNRSLVKVRGLEVFAKEEIETPYFGAHALENFLAALVSLSCLFPEKIAALTSCKDLLQVPGRLEIVSLEHKKTPLVVVDYAHTPDALEKAITVLLPLKKEDSKLHVVFGCGGDRDKGKRPLMGEIAERLCDQVVLTSDNPRSEVPEQIISEILNGLKHRESIKIIMDRSLAIEETISFADNEDIILIAGKGHEREQIFATHTIAFCDQDEARKALTKRTAC